MKEVVRLSKDQQRRLGVRINPVLVEIEPRNLNGKLHYKRIYTLLGRKLGENLSIERKGNS